MNVTSSTPLVLPYQNTDPAIQGAWNFARTGSSVLGRVTLGEGASMADYAVVRADGHVVEIGDGFHLGERSTIHIAHALYGTYVGHHVSVGRNAVVHACRVGNDCVIEDSAVILDGAEVGAGSIIGAHSVVFPRTVLEGGQRYEGVPAKPVGAADAAMLEAAHRAVRAAAPLGGPALPHFVAGAQSQLAPGAYVASTVTGQGDLKMESGSSIWFSCVIDTSAGNYVSVGRDSNVQDNTVMRALAAPIRIGAGCTIGHNVHLQDCTVGDRSLVGMGSTIAPGTVIEDDVLLAAGSTTTPGQVLSAGGMWGGRPARLLSTLDEKKKTMIAWSYDIYCGYARDYLAVESA